MRAVDTNILVYAHREESEWHSAARSCIQALAEGSASWAIPWPCVHEFLAVVTHPKIYAPPSPLPTALDQVEAWLESPTLVLLGEGTRHWQQLRATLAVSRVVGPRVHDARIAALCMQHGITTLLTADRDFSRFGGLKTANPLVA